MITKDRSDQTIDIIWSDRSSFYQTKFSHEWKFSLLNWWHAHNMLSLFFSYSILKWNISLCSSISIEFSIIRFIRVKLTIVIISTITCLHDQSRLIATTVSVFSLLNFRFQLNIQLLSFWIFILQFLISMNFLKLELLLCFFFFYETLFVAICLNILQIFSFFFCLFSSIDLIII